jgi:acetylornithine aminotransferase
VHAGFEPLLSGFVRAPFNDIEAIQAIADNNSGVVAVLVEPILGEGGIHIPDHSYLSALREICNQQDWLLMLDEVQTGNARTGKYFAYQHSDCLPDVVTTAKGLGNGVPIGACLARGEAAELFVPGNHGSTFGGNPLACAAAHAVLDVIEEEDICTQAHTQGLRIVEALETQLAGNNSVKEVRGLGMMIAVELNQDAPDLVSDALHSGLLVNVTQGNVVRLLPPLNMSNQEADELVSKLTTLLNR